jgi:hypothetical protein
MVSGRFEKRNVAYPTKSMHAVQPRMKLSTTGDLKSLGQFAGVG